MAVNRYYSATAQDTTLSGTTSSSVLTITVAAATGFPSTFPYCLALDYGSALEELVDVTSAAGLTLTVTRGVNGTTAAAHALGATVRHVITARDMTESQAHIAGTTGVHGVTGSVVGDADTQTLTNKKLSDSTTTIVDVTDATKAIKFDVAGTTGITGTIASAFTTAKTVTLPDATDTLVGKATTDTLTNKNLTSATNTFPSTLAVVALTLNAQTGTTYTPVLTDATKLVTLSNAGAITLTVPTNASVAYPTGSQINIQQIGAGQVTIVGDTGVTISATGTKLRVQWSGATLVKTDTNVWTMFGDIA